MVEQMPILRVPSCRIYDESDVAIAGNPDDFDYQRPYAGRTQAAYRQHFRSFQRRAGRNLAIRRGMDRTKLRSYLDSDGFNIGVNDGLAAGQTVMHAHFHIIPRKKGDSPDQEAAYVGLCPRRRSIGER